MSSDFYNLREEPFGDTPDPRFLFRSQAHTRAFERLMRHTSARERLQTVIAPPGAGKTTLLFALIEQVPRDIPVALLTNTLLNRTEFLGYLLRTFEIDDTDRTIERKRVLLTEFLTRQTHAGKSVIVIVDEAQHLELGVLEEIRDLVLNAPESLQVILAGQPQLKDSLRQPSVSVLLSGIPHDLSPLDANETSEYVKHRLTVAGHSGPDLFAPNAIRAIARESAGVPRSINMLCYVSMLHAAILQVTPIDRELVQDAISRFHALEPTPPPTKLKPRAAARPKPLTTSTRGAMDMNFASTTPLNPTQNVLDNERTAFADMVHDWLEHSGQRWTGTASELQQVVRPVAERHAKRFSAVSAKDLVDLVERSVAELRSRGVEGEVRTRPGAPRMISLRLIDGGNGSVQPQPEHPLDASEQPHSVEPTTPSKERAIPNPTGDRGEEVASIRAVPTAVAEADAPPVDHPAPVPVAEEAKVQAPAEAPTFAPVLYGLTATEDNDITPANAAQRARNLLARIDRLYITTGVAVIVLFLAVMLYARHALPHSSKASPHIATVDLPSASQDQMKSLMRDAESGDPDAQYGLAMRYASGNGVSRSDEQAMTWLRRAAEKGQSDAQYQLGSALARDNVVAGYPWLVLAKEAGAQGSAELLNDLTPHLSNSDIGAIRFELGKMFANGVGVAQDDVAAYTWFQLATAAGDHRADAESARLKSRMKDNEVTEATKRADDWLQQHQH